MGMSFVTDKVEQNSKMKEGPDQGFAWVVALACFVINFIMAGLARTAGVLYVALINLYGVSRQEATTPFSIRVCVRNLTGPLIGLLGQKYGIRGIVLIGGAVAALGSILCCFAPSITLIVVCWGVIHGLGFGLSTVLHMIMIGKYFDKYKASALGLSFSGDCFGTFAFPVIIEHLLCSYGLRSTFLILGGMVLNVVPMALLLREPPWTQRERKAKICNQAVQNNKMSTNLAVMENTNHLEIYLEEKASQTSPEDLELFDTISTKRCKEAPREDSPPDYENIPPTVPGSGNASLSCRLTGHCNLAFKSSDSDISSLNDPIEMNISKIANQPSYAQEQAISAERPSHEGATKSCQSVRSPCSRSSSTNIRKGGNTDNPSNDRQIRKIRSVSDLNVRNDFQSGLNKSPRMNGVLQAQSRRDSLPPVLERESSLKEKSESDETADVEDSSSVCVDTANVSKKRTSSFVGSVAQEIVNRLRSASFASQVASDGFCASIPQESQAVLEEEMECELRSIVEHKDHDIHEIDYCNNKDLILSVDKIAMGEQLKDSPPDKAAIAATEKPKSSGIPKQLLKINTKPIFILISVSMAVYAFLFVSVLTIIIDYAKDLGISDENGKFLIIAFSLADLVGRLSFGQVIDRKLMKMKNFAGSTMVIMGTIVAAIPLNVSFNYLMVCMCMYGFIQGGTAIMFPLLVNMYMDPLEEPVAMGCLNFYGGLLMLLIAPMIGYYRDNTGSYNCVFYIIGGVVVVVGVLWQFEPMILKYQNKKLREKYIMKEIAALQRN